ncbi:hypothetical protein QAD02_017811 [Eretmocerus hayati]|uniref:Uncharacterized protein n=1 Tax=Eretmocerus hayati TaxID=131215 RepID=A0ACC2PFE8_9HYME|nr:hypothetical protein QAD02_017811 [Eretmocerus hayati]
MHFKRPLLCRSMRHQRPLRTGQVQKEWLAPSRCMQPLPTGKPRNPRLTSRHQRPPTGQLQSAAMQQPRNTALPSLEEALKKLKRRDPRKRVERWVKQSTVWTDASAGMRDLLEACKSAHTRQVKRETSHHRRPRTSPAPASSSRPPSPLLAAAPSDRPILGASRPIASVARSSPPHTAPRSSTNVVPPSTVTGEACRLWNDAPGPREQRGPDTWVFGRSPNEIDSDEPVVVGYRRAGSTSQAPTSTTHNLDGNLSDSNVSIVWSKHPGPLEGGIGQGYSRRVGDFVKSRSDSSATRDSRSRKQSEQSVCSFGSVDTLVMPRKPTTPVSPAELYVLVDAYTTHRTPTLAQALINAVSTDLHRAQERERATRRRAEDKERLEALTPEQREAELCKRRTARKQASRRRASQSQLTRSTASEADSSDADTGIHFTRSVTHTPEPPASSACAAARGIRPPRKRSCRSSSAPATQDPQLYASVNLQNNVSASLILQDNVSASVEAVQGPSTTGDTEQASALSYSPPEVTSALNIGYGDGTDGSSAPIPLATQPADTIWRPPTHPGNLQILISELGIEVTPQDPCQEAGASTCRLWTVTTAALPVRWHSGPLHAAIQTSGPTRCTSA